MHLSIILLLFTMPYTLHIPASTPVSQQNVTRKIIKYQDEINQLVEILRTVSDQNTRETIENKLVSIAKKTRQTRLHVIKSITSMMDDIAEENAINYDHAWQAASNILVEIKATEAIESLTRHFDRRMVIVSMTLGGYPPARAIYRMGETAVPSLRRIVLEGEIMMRRNAASALGLIGGMKARMALEAALRAETDKETLGRIEEALSQIEKMR